MCSFEDPELSHTLFAHLRASASFASPLDSLPTVLPAAKSSRSTLLCMDGFLVTGPCGDEFRPLRKVWYGVTIFNLERDIVVKSWPGEGEV